MARDRWLSLNLHWGLVEVLAGENRLDFGALAMGTKAFESQAEVEAEHQPKRAYNQTGVQVDRLLSLLS
jgi:hypothetical protein